MRRLKVVFDASPLLVNRTGVAYYTERLVAQLAKQYPVELELVGFYYNFLGRKRVDHLPSAPNIHWRATTLLPSKILFQLRRWGIELPVECWSRTRADFVLYPNFWCPPSLFRSPSAPVLHDLTYLDLPEYVSPKLRRDLERFVPQAIQRASFVITVSEFTKRRIAEAYSVPAKNILVTPIPPEPNRTFSEHTARHMLHEAGITKPYLLFLGTIEPRKNILQLMEAYTKLPAYIREGFSLVIVGRVGWLCDKEMSELKRLQHEGYDIKHLGYVDEAQRALLYANATLFVHASHYEGFGMPVLEAMAYGVPCAVSDIPVFREVGGDSVRYFNGQDPEDIARAVQDLLEHSEKAKAMGRAGQQRAQSLSWEAVAASVFERIKAATRLS